MTRTFRFPDRNGTYLRRQDRRVAKFDAIWRQAEAPSAPALNRPSAADASDGAEHEDMRPWPC